MRARAWHDHGDRSRPPRRRHEHRANSHSRLIQRSSGYDANKPPQRASHEHRSRSIQRSTDHCANAPSPQMTLTHCRPIHELAPRRYHSTEAYRHHAVQCLRTTRRRIKGGRFPPAFCLTTRHPHDHTVQNIDRSTHHPQRRNGDLSPTRSSPKNTLCVSSSHGRRLLPFTSTTSRPGPYYL